jgi:LuxR family maltose regulon positive regulatory protein
LKTKLARAQDHQFTISVIQTQIILALAYQRQVDRGQALIVLEQAVITAQSGGFIRSFVDLGHPMEQLLAALSGRLPVESLSYLNQLITSFETNETPRYLIPGSQFPASNPQPPVAESITRREVEVLRLMKTGKTDQEIADGLMIALPTARRHASNVYRKLEVNNRRQAVHKAEQLGLLRPT